MTLEEFVTLNTPCPHPGGRAYLEMRYASIRAEDVRAAAAALTRSRATVEPPTHSLQETDMATKTQQTPQEYKDAFIAEHGGPLLETGNGDYLLADGARISQRGQPVYYPPPTHPYDVWRYRFQYATARLEEFNAALRAITAIVVSEASVAAGANVIATHTFRWDAERLGTAPKTSSPRVAMLILRSRRRKLAKAVAELYADPLAALLLPLMHSPNPIR